MLHYNVNNIQYCHLEMRDFMSRILRILLVEDDMDVCKRFHAEIEEWENMTLLDTTNDSSAAINLTKDHFPDVVILDLELNNGKGNGLDYLSKLKSVYLPVRPFILVTTNNSSTIIHETARNLGADFIISKYQDGYSEKSVLDFLEMTRNTIFRVQQTNNSHTPDTKTPSERNQHLKRCISAELTLVGIKPKSVGFEYLIEAIFLAINGDDSHLLQTVGKKFRKSKPSIERGIQNSISRAWRTADIDQLLTHYKAPISPERGYPTVTEFIYYYVNKIKNEQN